MPLSLQGVLGAIGQAGSHLPAFKALFDQAIETFGPDDQATLKNALAKARQQSDAQHASLQGKLADAGKR